MVSTNTEKQATHISCPGSGLIEELSGCPICGSTESLQKDAFKLRDHSLTGETFSVSKCTECNALLTDPRPTAAQIGKYYDFPEYISHRDDAPGLINRLYQLARRWTTKRKLTLLNELKPAQAKQRKLLDYGCGTGYFLRAAKEANWQVEGVELNAEARAIAREKAQSKITGELGELPTQQRYDVITLWHVLEHVHELNSTLEHLLTRLAPDGTMVIAVPNPQSMDAREYGEWWAAYDVPRHLYHFTPLSINRLITRHGAYILTQKGQALDSFYISLLSEKYRRGFVMRGLLSGVKSTVSAWQTGDYSSMIYVIKRLGE